ncbi:MAG: nucleotidyltransferase domain-containing protein [Bacteroidales bacterium]|nr:nucleotidyltransferase domain-containing protein [Bacteroidales bacterium]MCF8402523.1 nucleotidyltransferase domain-containing protein [Bacteroidales bacterium]
MRLSDFQIEAIQHSAKRFFGEKVRVYLFGSRIDNNSKGGDIDLLIRSGNEFMTYTNKLLFLVELKKKIGEQKIDVVFDKGQNSGSNFMSTIKNNNVQIC